MVLIIGLIARASSERSSAKAYSSAASARQLSEVAINLVQGQITSATTQGGDVTWASQPGMIRTFDAVSDPSTGRSNLLLAYKLYSAETLVQNKIVFVDGNLPEDAPPNDWAANPGVWTDLNEPIMLKVDGADQSIYPILDPKAGTALGVEGYVPRGLMEKLPVRWLYVLKDGSLKSGVSSSGNSVKVEGATETNPIVGRIAFWADDDTCKINLNTAGMGEAEDINTTDPTLNGAEPEPYWDIPRFMTEFDRNLLANAQPAQKEFTRYPGHPAWTTLSTVFPTLSMADGLSQNMLPRYQWGGSRGGSRRADAPITLKTPPNRLFATVDEFIFDPSRSKINYQPSDLQKLRFFLTTNSRSPEINLFNLPRVACWPIADASLDDSYRTAYDRLISFASSMKGRAGGTKNSEPYYFQRKDADSATKDFTITRNIQLYDYLERLTRRPIPGFGGDFQSKYTSSESQQILTSIIDYIRCINLFDDNLPPGRQFTNGILNATKFFEQPPGHGQVTPLRHPTNGTQGFGRFYTVSEFAIQFICNADGSGEFKNPAPAPPGPTNPPKTFANLTDQVNNDAKIMSNIATGPYRNVTLNGVKLNPNEKRIEAMVHLELFCPALGSRPISADTQIRVNGLDNFRLNGTSMGFPATGVVKLRNSSVNFWGGLADGGGAGLRFLLMPNDTPLSGPSGSVAGLEAKLKRSPARGFMPPDAGADSDLSSPNYNLYPFLSVPLTISVTLGANQTMAFSGGEVTVEIFSGSSGPPSDDTLVQTIRLKVPSGTFPVPNIVSLGTIDQGGIGGLPTNRSYWWTFSRDGATPGLGAINTATVRSPAHSGWNNGRLTTFSPASQLFTFNSPYGPKTLLGPTVPSSTVPLGSALIRGGNQTASNASAFPQALANVQLEANGPFVKFPARANPSDMGLYCPQGFDVIRSLLPQHGDYRIIAGRKDVPDSEFVPHPDWNNLSKMFACNLWEKAPLERLPTFPVDAATPLGSETLRVPSDVSYVEGVRYGSSGGGGVMAPDIIPGYLASTVPDARKPSKTGDFDNGLPLYVDGPYINKADEGNASYTLSLEETSIPYFDTTSSATQGSVLFSPNRIMPSPGMFGSLSTGIQRLQPWQTLLLRPQPDHPNAGSPADHLLLDLFWMPTVEPYAISDPFATAGKVNMNSQLMPFTWIERTTALRAVLKSERMIVVPNSQGMNYKSPAINSPLPLAGTTKSYRLPLFIDNTASGIKDDTMQNFHARFRTGDIFRSPTEICDLWMVPKGSKLSEMTSYWNDKRLTGDESRERIYTTLLPRLTTKSNTYTVHVRAQALQKVSSTSPTEWVEGKDIIKGEYRGSTTIERYLDPNDESIPDYATDPSSCLDKPLDRFYKWRQLQTVDFSY